MSTNLHDIKNNSVSGVSHKPGTALSGSSASNGTGVDCGLGVGNVTGVFLLGDNTGNPTSVAVALALEESDSSGSGYAAITGATATLAAHATNNNGTVTMIVSGIRSKKYVRAVATPTFVGGTSPTQPIASMILLQKAQV